MTDTIMLQGRFTSTGANVLIPAPFGGWDWMRVYNTTQMATQQATGRGVEFYWQNGFANGAAIEWKKTNSTDAINGVMLTTGGFYVYDSSLQQPGVLNNGSTGLSALSNAAIPVATVGSTAGMAAGSVVRLYNVAGADQVNSIDFTVGYNTFSPTTFSLDYMSQLAVAGTTGSFRVIPYDPIYYPRRRYITKITQAQQAVVTFSVTHGYKVGQVITFRIPSAFGMTQLDNQYATIVAVNTATTGAGANSVTINIDTTGYTAFAWPAAGSTPMDFALAVPVGQDTGYSLYAGVDILSDATLNTATQGLLLTAGAQGPAGSTGSPNDVIYWQAGQVFSTNNQ